MKRDEFDKSIICNDNLDAPSRDVLYAAKAEMRRNAVERKKLSPSKIFAIASACVAVVVLLCCVPLMMESIQALNYESFAKLLSTVVLEKSEITSIEDFNKENNHHLMTFDKENQSLAYVYRNNDTDKYCFMLYAYENTQIEVFVKLKSNGQEFPSGDSETPSNNVGSKIEYINDCKVEYVIDSDNRVFAKFYCEGEYYMLKMQGETTSWRNLLANFIK